MTNRWKIDRYMLVVCGIIAAIGTVRVSAAADDPRPVVDDSKIDAPTATASTLPTLYLVGDSTLNSNGAMRGWAQEIGAYFDPAKINVVNRAIGGRSSRTFMNEGRWDKVLKELKPGDFVIVQFGHNDAGRHDDPAAKGRPSLKGDGDETADVTKPDGTKGTIHTFGWYMRKYVTDAKANGATVIVASMVPHKDWKDGKISRGERATLVKWTKEAAEKTGAGYIDLNEIIARGYERIGQEKVESYFADKRTHTSAEGAKYSAGMVIAALKGLDQNPLGPYLSKASDEINPVKVENKTE